MRPGSHKILTGAWLALLCLGLSGAAGAYSIQYAGSKPVKWNASSSSFQVNTANMPGGALDSIKEAMNTWSQAGASFSVSYAGSSSSHDFGNLDGTNLIDHGKLDSNDTVAYCYYWYDTKTGYLKDTDIRLNSALSWATSGDGGSYDVQNVVTHELGHSLTLLDLYDQGDAEKTMYGITSKGETKKRTLDDDDKNGIRTLYP